MEISRGKLGERIHVYLQRGFFTADPLGEGSVALQIIDEDAMETEIVLNFKEVKELIEALKEEVNSYYESKKLAE